MEKIKVNMSPNPLDVQTIHASQNDGEARQWEFELHNNGELIDTSEVTDQMVFKAYKGGTEQILPENTSTPTTSPFNGDIRYPQGLLTDQEFTYRQSPTEEDGLAKITDIKGNTLNWNQLVNYTWFSTLTRNGITLTNNNDGSFTVSGTATADVTFNIVENKYTSFTNHKLLLKGCPSGGASNNYCLIATLRQSGSWRDEKYDVGNGIVFITQYERVDVGILVRNGKTVNLVFRPMLFDLTQMGLDITDPSEFTSLFNLPYYSYNQGSLLSFNGTGIKTVGKNLIGEMTSGLISTADGVSITSNPYWLYSDFIGCFENEYMCFSANINNRGLFYCYDSSKSFKAVVQVEINKSYVVIRPKANNIAYVRIGFNVSGASTLVDPSSVETYELQVEYNDHRTEYEPCTTSTLSLPISTYFPNGMKSAGNVYDELTESKAITRVGMVDLGSLPLFYYTPPTSDKPIAQFSAILPNALSNVNTNVRCALYTASSSPVYGRTDDKTVCTFNGRVYICDSAYTDATAFKTAMNGVYLYFELATPTETEFTTASLVTENTEIPLSNEDGVLIGKCTEQLSENPGFIDAKIKLSDSDGECFSNKIQLHIERSPQ